MTACIRSPAAVGGLTGRLLPTAAAAGPLPAAAAAAESKLLFSSSLLSKAPLSGMPLTPSAPPLAIAAAAAEASKALASCDTFGRDEKCAKRGDEVMGGGGATATGAAPAVAESRSGH